MELVPAREALPELVRPDRDPGEPEHQQQGERRQRAEALKKG